MNQIEQLRELANVIMGPSMAPWACIINNAADALEKLQSERESLHSETLVFTGEIARLHKELALKVKPLEWKKTGNEWRAPSPFGKYLIMDARKELWRPYRINENSNGEWITEKEVTLQLAQSECQADFERRVMECMETEPKLTERVEVAA